MAAVPAPWAIAVAPAAVPPPPVPITSMGGAPPGGPPHHTAAELVHTVKWSEGGRLAFYAIMAFYIVLVLAAGVTTSHHDLPDYVTQVLIAASAICVLCVLTINHFERKAAVGRLKLAAHVLAAPGSAKLDP